jgi:hypothetical protein
MNLDFFFGEESMYYLKEAASLVPRLHHLEGSPLCCAHAR